MFNDPCFRNVVLSNSEEFWKSAIILWSYRQDYSGTLFMTRSIYCFDVIRKTADIAVFLTVW